MTRLCEPPLILVSFCGLLGYPLSLSPPSFSVSPHLMSDDSISLDDADWEVLSDLWWHTPLTMAPSPLSWIDPEPTQSRPRPRSEVAARNSHYWHELLLLVTKSIQGVGVCCSSCQEWRYIDSGGTFVCDAMKGVGVQGDLDLNPDLVGVEMVLAMVDELERAVGIATTEHHTAGEIATLARRVSQLLGNAQPVVNPEDYWNEYTATVVDGDGIAPHGVPIYRPDLNADPPPADSITPILDLDLDPPRRKSPRFSREVIDLTDSEQSVASEAPPATPKPERSFAAGGDGTMPGTLSSFVISLIITCTLLHISLTGDLPKCHLIRVPSSPSISYSFGSPLTSDWLRSESSHTRCSSLPPGDLHKEDYDVEVVSESTPSEDADIPLFLVTSSDRLIRQHSRTRAIIDRLRSVDAPRGRVKTSSTRGNSNPSTPAKNPRVGLNNATVKRLFQKGSDGWIRLADDAEHTASRAKVTSQAGPADASPNSLDDSEPSESEEAIFAPPVPESTRDSRKKQTQGKQLRRGSGRVDAPPPTKAAPAHATVTSTGPPRGAHGHRLAQSAQVAAPASVGTFTFPPPTHYAFPGQPVPQFMPMSFGPPPYRGYPAHGGYPQTSPPFIGPLPHQYQHHQHQHQHQHPYPHPYLYQPNRATYANAPVITGSAGIRHAQW